MLFDGIPCPVAGLRHKVRHTLYKSGCESAAPKFCLLGLPIYRTHKDPENPACRPCMEGNRLTRFPLHVSLQFRVYARGFALKRYLKDAKGRVGAIRYEAALRGSTRPHLLRFDDGNSYVTKFRGNPKGDRILISEFVASALLRELDFARLDGRIVNVDSDLISNQPELAGLTGGPQFGSLYEPVNVPFSAKDLIHLTNRNDLPQFILFNALLCNVDQHLGNILFVKDRSQSATAYRFVMIDHSHIFGGPEWNDHALDIRKKNPDLYLSPVNLIDDAPDKLEVLEPFLLRLEALTEHSIRSILDDVPGEWGFTSSDMSALLDFLMIRKDFLRFLVSRNFRIR
jgi:hypothetical protein